MDELLDLVDDHDQVIGQKMRSDVYALRLTNFRVINAFVRNDQGYLWIPRRTGHKTLFPLCLDMSVGGHVTSGESYEAAFSREAREELNLDITAVPHRFLGYLSPRLHGVSAFMKVYEISLSSAPEYNTDDFIEGFWILPRDLQICLAAGEKSKSDLPVLLEYFYTRC